MNASSLPAAGPGDMAGDILGFIREKLGFSFDDARQRNLTSLVARRMTAIRSGSEAEYLDYIRSVRGAGELNLLIGGVTVGETYFLRNMNHWQALKTFVLPRIMSAPRKKSDRRLTFWSAGCATGEEPYSIAIILSEIRFMLDGWKIRIFGADVNQASLAAARAGAYTQNAFRGVDDYYIRKYFRRKKGKYILDEAVRNMVEFDVLNLTAAPEFPRRYQDADVIFCRNVLMYFRPEIYRNALTKFHKCLCDGGFLFLGHAEGHIVPTTLYKPEYSCDAFVYRKRRPEKAVTVRPGTVRPVEPKAAATRRRSGRRGREDAETSGEQGPDRPREATAGGTGPDAAAAYDAALRHYFREDYAETLSLLSKIKFPATAPLDVLALKTLACIGMSKLKQAAFWRERAVAASDTAPEPYCLEGMIKEAENDFEAAAAAHQAAIFLDKTFFAPHFRMGLMYQALGEPGKSDRHFSNALKLLKIDAAERIRLFSGGVSVKLLEDMCSPKAL